MKRITRTGRLFVTACVMLGTAIVITAGTVNATEIPPEYQCNIDWTQCKGESITVLFGVHPWQQAVEPLIPEFEKLTGIKIKKIKKLTMAQFYSKVPADFTAGTFSYDVFMHEYYEATKFQQEGWTAPLGIYLFNSRLTDAEWYDWKDFFPASQYLSVIGGKYIDRLPITCEAQTLLYRKDIFENLGLQVPDTFDAYLEVAKTIKNNTDLAGFSCQAADALWWPMYGVIRSYGGDYFTPDGSQIFIDTPESIAGMKMFAELVRCGPPGLITYQWEDTATVLMAGKAATFLDSSVMYSSLQNPARSRVVGKIGTAPFPKGPAGRIAHSHYWSICINNYSKKKHASWLFIQWLTSKPVMLEMAKRKVAAPRASTWASPEFKATFPHDFIEGVSETLKTAVISPANLGFWALADVLRRIADEVIEGKKEAEPAMREVAKRWKKMFKE